MKKIKMPVSSEKVVHKELCKYIRLAHPRAIFFSDMSGLRVSIGTAVDMKAIRSSKAIPDLFVASTVRGFAGLFIEIKKEASEVYKKDGSMKNNQHIMEQLEMLKTLRLQGYRAEFGLGLEHCRKVVDDYFN